MFLFTENNRRHHRSSMKS